MLTQPGVYGECVEECDLAKGLRLWRTQELMGVKDAVHVIGISISLPRLRMNYSSEAIRAQSRVLRSSKNSRLCG